jgi:hypothetical protein
MSQVQIVEQKLGLVPVAAASLRARQHLKGAQRFILRAVLQNLFL